ncbi:MAG: DUF481 domain-containing protein [Epsilonproteobacteria bacterium]|nr:hypothetical protein [Campylobacterota bacterium]NPA57626.1 DUF481 domain-containing protein [Campylobacterota bacterium]
MRPVRVLLSLLLPSLIWGEAKVEQKVELGYFGTTGNSNVTSLTTAYRIDYRIDRDNRVKLKTDILYSTKSGKKSSERYRSQLDIYHYIDRDRYLYSQFSFLRNTFRGYNQQYNISPGLGHRFHTASGGRLDLLLGYLFRRNNYTKGGGENFNYLKGEVRYFYRFTKKNSFETKLSFIENIDERRDLESQWLSKLKLWIVDSFHFKLSFELKYDNLPPGNKRKIDTITKGSIVYTF